MNIYHTTNHLLWREKGGRKQIKRKGPLKTIGLIMRKFAGQFMKGGNSSI